MRGIRRKEQEIKDKQELISIVQKAEYVTIAMCSDNEPYLVTLNHGYDRNKNCIYFYCAQEGKKIDILKGDEQAILKLVMEEDGIDQRKIQEITDFSKAKVSKIISELEKRGVVRKEQIGRRNKIYLAGKLRE